MKDDLMFTEVLSAWKLPEKGDLLDRLEEMIRPALWAGHFGKSTTRFVAGLQYHLGGAQDTRELADLAHVTASDHILDVCCFIGGPAIQLAHERGCHVTGIDINPNAIAAAQKLAELSGLSHFLQFRVADAKALPFGDGVFSVAWNQCSLKHSEEWLREFDRVLAPGGRIAVTFQLRGTHSDEPDDNWTLDELASLVERLGYSVQRADNITERDIKIGWMALDRKLYEHEKEFDMALGTEWVKRAHQEFQTEAQCWRDGRCGNGRIVAVKGVSS